MTVYRLSGRDEPTRELLQALLEARDGDIIELEYGGEYQGPFFIGTTISLVGQGATTIYSNTSPALVIAANGVKLKRLAIHNTQSDTDAAILHRPNAVPLIEEVDLNGRMVAVPQGDWIPLGLIHMAATLSVPIEFVVPEAATLELTMPNATLAETNLPRIGGYMADLRIEPHNTIDRSTVVGVIAMRLSSATRYLVPYYTYIQTAPPQAPKQLALIVNGHTFVTRSRLVLGAQELGSVLGINYLREPVGIIQRESNDGWALYRPWEKSPPLIHNQRSLMTRERVFLTMGDTLQIGNVALQVKFSHEQYPYFEPEMLDFAQSSSPHRLELVNPTKRTIKGQARTTVGWLSLVPSDVTCAPQGRTEMTVTCAFPDGQTGSVLFQSGHETVIVSVHTAVQTPKIHVSPVTLDFGAVNDWQVPQADITITNTGTSPLIGRLSSRVAWLEIDQPNVHMYPGAQQRVTVRLADAFLLLNQGETRLNDVLSFQGSDTLPSIGARVVRSDPSTQIVPELQVIGTVDFGDVADAAVALPIQVTILNRIGADWEGSVKSAAAWLRVQPSLLSIPAGGQTQLVVSLEANAYQNLPEGRYDLSGGIRIDSTNVHFAPYLIPIRSARIAASRASEPVRVTFANEETSTPPSIPLRAVPPTIQFGTGETWDQAARECRIMNETAISYDIEIRSPEWMEITQITYQLQAHREVQLQVRLRPGYPARRMRYEGLIEIWQRGGQSLLNIPVTYRFRRPETEKPLGWLTRETETDANPERASDIIKSTGKQGGSIFENPTAREVTSPESSSNPVQPKSRLFYTEPEELEAAAPIIPPQPTALPAAATPIRKPSIRVHPSEIAFMDLDNWEVGATYTFDVINEGRGMWYGKIEATVPWLRLELTSDQIAIGTDAKPVQVALAEKPNQAVSSLYAADAIIIHGENTHITLAVRVEIKPKKRRTLFSE